MSLTRRHSGDAPTGLRGWARVSAAAGSLAAAASRRFRVGGGSIIGGRIALALCPTLLSRAAAGRRVVLVSGTNGKTSTSHLLAAALRTAQPVAHNASGANMTDGVVAALMGAPRAPLAVLEVDELHLARVAAAVNPAVVVILNLSRDQLDRGTEVRTVAAALRAALTAVPQTTVVANADDPMVVWAADGARRVVWVAAGSGWTADAATCPRCGRALCSDRAAITGDEHARWLCPCGLACPASDWALEAGGARTPAGFVPLALRLPGRFNDANAVLAMAAAEQLGVSPPEAARAMADVETVAGRYAIVLHGDHELRLLLAKNPAGFTEAFDVLEPARSLLVDVNAREADGRDTSWLWDVPFERIAPRPVAAAGERAADVGVRLSYAGIDHHTTADPLSALEQLPAGKVDVLANYTAFHQMLLRLTIEKTGDE